jgi:tRNA pseudouridine38-40 synthase
MARYFLRLSYLGGDFNGWQSQKNTPNTVQAILEKSLGLLLREKISITGCGRTDTGVNARNFVAHCDSHKDLLADKLYWIGKFNSALPKGISVSDIRPVRNEAHARYDALERVYHYTVITAKDPFLDPLAWHLHGQLNFLAMNEAASLLMDFSDFSCFSKSRTQVKSNICRISEALWVKAGDHEWKFIIRADRFLRGMVRAIVGTLVLIGQEKLSLLEFRKIIESKDRKKAGPNAPARGLFFEGVAYPEDLFLGS